MKARLSVVLCGLSIAFTANATNVFTNGDFGTGDLTGWTLTTSPLFTGYPSGFYVTNAPVTPLNGFPTVGADAPSTFYAVSDDQGPGSMALTQSFFIPLGTTAANLSFAAFVNDLLGGSGFGGEVDILAGGADAILGTPITVLYAADTAVAGGNPNPWVPFAGNIMGSLIAGNTYQIRVFASDSTGPINVGADNFDLELTGALAAPEPSMFLPVGLLAGFLAFRVRKARS